MLTAQALGSPRRARDPRSRSRANPDRYRCRPRRQRAGRSMLFRPAPSIIAETPKGLAAAWRLKKPHAARKSANDRRSHRGTDWWGPLGIYPPARLRWRAARPASEGARHMGAGERPRRPGRPGRERCRACVPRLRAGDHAGRAQGRGRGVLGAVRERSQALELRHSRHRRPRLGQDADAQRADRRRGPHGLPDLHLRLQERLFGAKLRAGHRAEGARCAPAWHSVQPADAQRQRGRPGPAHRAHFHHHGRIEARVRARRPPDCDVCAMP